jgi:hypothetical protein
VALRGEKAKGNKLAFDHIKKIAWGNPLPPIENEIPEQPLEDSVPNETETNTDNNATGYSPGTVIDFGDDQPTLF